MLLAMLNQQKENTDTLLVINAAFCLNQGEINCDQWNNWSFIWSNLLHQCM